MQTLDYKVKLRLNWPCTKTTTPPSLERQSMYLLLQATVNVSGFPAVLNQLKRKRVVVQLAPAFTKLLLPLHCTSTPTLGTAQ